MKIMSKNHLWSPPPVGTFYSTPLEILSDNDVHVWCADLDQAGSSVQELTAILSEDEQIRAEKFRFAQHRHRFIAARGILRKVLGFYLGIQPSELQFIYSSRGKPALTKTCNAKKLSFNLSHSQGLALYGITYDANIGVDLEYIRPMSDVEKIVGRFFADNESNLFQKIPDHEKLVAFFNAWTGKEAYLKATGEGLAGHLDQIEVSLIPEEPAKLLSIKGNKEAAEGWCLKTLTPATSYVATVAVEGQISSMSCWQWQDKE